MIAAAWRGPLDFGSGSGLECLIVSMRHCLRVLLLTVFAAAAAAAQTGTTLRYRVDWKFGGLVPPEALAKLDAALPSQPHTQLLEIEGTKAFSRFGALATIYDLSAKQITLLDFEHQHFAVTSFEDYGKAATPPLPALSPAEQKMLDAFHFALTSQPGTDTTPILNIPVSETDYTISMTQDFAKLTGQPPPDGLGSQPMLRVDMQVWNAAPGASLGNDALAQVETLDQISALMLNPLAHMQQALAALPAPLNRDLGKIVAGMSAQHTPALRIHATVYMPEMAAILRLAQQMKPNQPLPDMDPDAPLGELNVQADELVSGAVPAADFSVPDGFSQEPVRQLVKELFPPSKPISLPRTLGDAPSGAARAQQVPTTPPLRPGQALPPNQLSWLRQLPGQSSSAAFSNPGYVPLLHMVIPEENFHMGTDMPLGRAFNAVMHGPPYPVASFGGGSRLILSAQRGHGGRGRAFLWMDLTTGQAIGGLFLYFRDGQPSPALSLFSNQLQAPVTQLSQLPPHFAEDYASFRPSLRIPTSAATYFIASGGETSVLLHTPAPCAQGDAICEAENTDAADSDVQVALWFAGQRLGGADAIAALHQQENDWEASRRTACAQPPSGETVAACKLRMAQARVKALMGLQP